MVDGDEDAAWVQSANAYTIAGIGFTGQAGDSEGVLHITGGDLTLSEVRLTDVEGNDDALYGYPHGIWFDAGTLSITDSTFSDNDLAWGTVMYVPSADAVTLHHVVIADNDGIAIQSLADDTEISNCLVVGNVMPGTLVYVSESDTSWVYNNVFADNPTDNPTSGGSPYFIARGTVDAQNNVFYRNGGYVLASSGNFQYNSVNGDDYSCSVCTGTGNLTSDPRFTDADAGDYTLDVGFSPLVNAGNPASGYNDVDGSRNDIGAYGGALGSW